MMIGRVEEDEVAHRGAVQSLKYLLNSHEIVDGKTHLWLFFSLSQSFQTCG